MIPIPGGSKLVVIPDLVKTGGSMYCTCGFMKDGVFGNKSALAAYGVATEITPEVIGTQYVMELNVFNDSDNIRNVTLALKSGTLITPIQQHRIFPKTSLSYKGGKWAYTPPAINRSCFDFDGVNYKVLSQISGFAIQNGFTVFCFVKGINAASNRVPWQFYADANNRINFRYPKNSTTNCDAQAVVGGVSANTSSIAVSGDWRPTSITYVGTELTLRADQSTKYSVTAPDISGFVGTPNLYFGGSYDGPKFIGKIAGFCLFSGSISDAQYTYLAGGGDPRLLPDLVLFFPYPTANGTVRDYSGLNNHASEAGYVPYSSDGGFGMPNLIDTSGNLGPECCRNIALVDSNSDGLADEWAYTSATASSIVTGNGFPAKAQRVTRNGGSGDAAQNYTFIAGKTYLTRYWYRSSNNFQVFWGDYTDAESVSANAGNAVLVQKIKLITAGTRIGFKPLSDGQWIEFFVESIRRTL